MTSATDQNANETEAVACTIAPANKLPAARPTSRQLCCSESALPLHPSSVLAASAAVSAVVAPKYPAPKATPPNANGTTSRATPRTSNPVPAKVRAPATVPRTPIPSTSRPHKRLPIKPPTLTNVKTSPSFKAGITSATSIFPKLSIAPYPKAHTKGYASKGANRRARLTGPALPQVSRRPELSSTASPASRPSSNTPSRTNPTNPTTHNIPKKAR